MSVDRRQLVERPDSGRELFYVAGDGRLMAVDVSKSAGSPLGVPRALFQTGGKLGAHDLYSPSSDGQRFLLNAVVDGRRPVIVLLNWRQAVPGRTPRT